ncbi:hypothetical protein [Herbaspirillum camelliae]|uniref:hypothetical protein n=1 Tax=Herbaspirillum camelliae TaxID=1892903 RepID=UPI00094A10D7|nr:hypothetical protein [Herbaspirillum camelliae]
MSLPVPVLPALAVVLLAVVGAVNATVLPGTGLGSSWPNAPDVSASPYYHVYRFERGGIRYVQVNDTTGTVRGAIAYAGSGPFLDLPIGMDASRWGVNAGTSSPPSGEPVYHDEAMSIFVTPQSDGSARMMVAPTKCDDDPLACSIRGP